MRYSFWLSSSCVAASLGAALACGNGDGSAGSPVTTPEFMPVDDGERSDATDSSEATEAALDSETEASSDMSSPVTSPSSEREPAPTAPPVTEMTETDEDEATSLEGAVDDPEPEDALPDVGTEGDGDFVVGPDYPLDPDLTDQGAPRGRDFQFTMRSEDSAIFRGEDTTLNADQRHAFARRVNVYVPARYQDGTEAPILVIQDGPGPIGLVRRALDNLTIEQDPTRRLPAFIAIAVANGGSDSKGSERGLEYDTMSDRYARFIETEVLPAVLANPEIRAAYPNLAFTSNPEGKATMGCSSGGAAALTMGWFRPDLFHRVISYSGTFVDQQDDDAPEEAEFPLGAWDYHSGEQLIQSSDPKPLRIFQHVSDMDNGAGAPEAGHHNWVMANQRTAEALAAKSYHYRFVFAQNAGHCSGKLYDLTLADTLLWTWRGYPVE